jgi:hypothetical protein
MSIAPRSYSQTHDLGFGLWYRSHWWRTSVRCCGSRADATASPKVAHLIASAVQGKSQEADRLRAFTAAFARVSMRIATKFDKLGLRRFQSRAESPQPRCGDCPSIIAILIWCTPFMAHFCETQLVISGRLRHSRVGWSRSFGEAVALAGGLLVSFHICANFHEPL